MKVGRMMLGERITKLRKHNNLTQLQLANKLKITRSALSQYETNSRQPDYKLLKKLSDLFNVSIDYLITGSEYSHSSDEMWKEVLNSKTKNLFTELQDAPEEKIDELLRFWEFIKQDKKK